VGGNVDARDGSAVSFARDVAPVFAAKCSYCHHVRGDAAAGARMPYTPPRRSASEIASLRAWIVAGALDN